MLQDDRTLLTLVEQGKPPEDISKHKCGKLWSTISRKFNGRKSQKQCRDRWWNYLRHGIKKGNWTSDEEELILDLYSTFGGR
jgi:transcription factor MYB, plant